MSEAKLTKGPVGKTLMRMTIPMVIGVLSMMLFNIIDTYWVSKLGNEALAAISFTFPVAYSSITLAMGIGVGAGAVIAKAIGEGDQERVKRLMNESLYLGSLVAVVVGALGILTHDWLFTLMGATDVMLPKIREYMFYWYAGMLALMLPIVCNAALRATGDGRTSGMVMGSAALLNLVLDPIMIFGYFGFPAMGIRGAAIATVISWLASLLLALYVMIKRGLFAPVEMPRWKETFCTWRKILYIGVPAGLTHMLTPLSAGVITAMVSEFGADAVAGFGVGSRVEPLALVVIIALTASLTPFIGQNWGAGLADRVNQAFRSSIIFSVAFELVMLPILLFGAYPIARAFSSHPATIATIVDFLWVLPFSYAFVGITLIISATFNAFHKPIHATVLNLLRLGGFLIPFAYYGGYHFGLVGLFVGVSVANIISGLVAMVAVRRTLKTVS